MNQPTVSLASPYVGPRTFGRDQARLYFGRDEEARDLLGRIISERLLLFYAQSGAGKSSLINTRIIPGLHQEGFAVLPVGRVSGELPPGVAAVENIFLFNLMLSIDQGNDDPARFAGLALGDFLANLVTDDGEHWEYEKSEDALEHVDDPNGTVATPLQPYVLIIDQFEEIITSKPARWQEREAFFCAINQAMHDDPNLWVVFTLREDHVAALDPYAALLADRLRARFYMERMGVPAALEAVRRPAQLGGLPFAPGVAAKLVDDLRQVRVPGQEGTVPGQYVEPVQLQVVCYQLWERVQGTGRETPRQEKAPEDPSFITEEDLAAAGDVDQALEHFYGATLAAVTAEFGSRQDSNGGQAAEVSESALRTWFDKELITETGIRSTVYRNEMTGRTGGLPNAAVDALARRYLLRTELRGGGAWVELVHDRFVDPIRASNAAWFTQHLSALQRQAALWNDRGRPPDLVLRGSELQAAEEWANTHRLEPHELAFMQACLSVRKTEERERRQRKRFQILAVVAVVISILAVAAAVLAFQQTQQAQIGERLATARYLSAQALAQVDQQLDLSLLLSLEANQLLDSEGTRETVLNVLQESSEIELFLSELGQTYSFEISPDGALLASAGEDGRILLWDVARGSLYQKPLMGHVGAVASVRFSHDGSLLASAGVDGRVILWNIADATMLMEPLTGHTDAVNTVAFSPDDRILASGGRDKTIILWDTVSGEPIAPQLQGHTDWVYSVAFGPDAAWLASAAGDNSVRLWDVATGQPIGEPLQGHSDKVYSLDVSPDGGTIASGSRDWTIVLWDVQTRQPRFEPLIGHYGIISSVKFSPDGAKLVSSSASAENLIVWDVETGRAVGQPFAGNGVSGALFHPDGTRLFAKTVRGSILILNPTVGNRLGTALRQHTDWVYDVAFAPNGATFVSAGADRRILLWDLASHELAGEAPAAHERPITTIAYSPDGKLAASGSYQEIILWDADSWEPIGAPLLGHSDWVRSLAFSPDGGFLASTGNDGKIILWDVNRQAMVSQHIPEEPSIIRSVIYDPTGQVLVTGGDDGTIAVWEAKTLTPDSRIFVGHTAGVTDLAFNADGSRLASASLDKTARIWDFAAAHLAAPPLTGHTGWVNGVAFSPNDEIIATAGEDTSVALWNSETGAPIGRALTGYSDKGVTSVVFDPTGHWLVSGDRDGNVILWDVQYEAWLTLACAVANRELTKAERDRYLGNDVVIHQTCAKPAL